MNQCEITANYQFDLLLCIKSMIALPRKYFISLNVPKKRRERECSAIV